MSNHWNWFDKAILASTHNICFRAKITKIVYECIFLSGPIASFCCLKSVLVAERLVLLISDQEDPDSNPARSRLEFRTLQYIIAQSFSLSRYDLNKFLRDYCFYVPKRRYCMTWLMFSSSLKPCSFIMKTCLNNFDPLKPNFYIVKLGFTGYKLFFLFLLKNIDCGYSLEPPCQGGSNEYPHSMF